MEGWKHVKLRDVAELNGGYAFKSSQYTEKGRLVLRTVNIRDDFSITLEGATYISEEDAPHFSKFSLKDKDTLFVMVAATLGKVGYVRSDVLPALLNQNMWVIRAIPGCIDPAFLHFCFRELSRVPLAWVSGSARSFLRRDDVRNLEFHLPPLPEQRAIAHILGTLDDKIELNRRMNETLEAMAQALFKSWFVDFDPVRAKMAGRDTGLPQHLADLFPDRLVESELGEIPEGWEAGALGDIAFSPRRSVKPASLDGETPYIGLEHMPRHSIALTEWENVGKVTSNKSIFEKGEVLFGKLRPYFHKVGTAPVDGVCSTDVVVIVSKATEWSAFALACVSSVKFVSYTNQASTGTKMPRTSWKIMGDYRMCLPTAPVARAFQNVAHPVLEHIIANIHESRTLASLRDTLLPKLVSGEVRVTLHRNGSVEVNELVTNNILQREPDLSVIPAGIVPNVIHSSEP